MYLYAGEVDQKLGPPWLNLVQQLDYMKCARRLAWANAPFSVNSVTECRIGDPTSEQSLCHSLALIPLGGCFFSTSRGWRGDCRTWYSAIKIAPETLRLASWKRIGPIQACGQELWHRWKNIRCGECCSRDSQL